MPTVNRNDLVRGPAQVAFDSITYQASGDVALAIEIRQFEVQVGGAKADERIRDAIVRARFAPSGKVEGLASLYAVLALPLGSGLMTNTDKPAVITNTARAVTLPAAGITKPPVIRASNVQSLFGEMEITGLTKNAVAFGTAASLLAHGAGGAPAGVATADIKTAPWTIGGGNLGAALECEEGSVQIECTPTWQEYGTDSNGILQFFLTDCVFEARLIPVMGASTFLDAVKAALELTRGASWADTGEDFVLTNGFITVTLNSANIAAAAAGQVINQNFAREVRIRATRTSSSAALGTVEVPSS